MQVFEYTFLIESNYREKRRMVVEDVAIVVQHQNQRKKLPDPGSFRQFNAMSRKMGCSLPKLDPLVVSKGTHQLQVQTDYFIKLI